MPSHAADAKKSSALACVVPHAGYMYSGHVAGAVYEQLELPRRLIILCPNHTGRGRRLAIMSEGAWETPLGLANIDSALAASLTSAFPSLEDDELAHRGEHAIEVQLPFLQLAVRDFTFVPIAVGTAHFEALYALGTALAKVIQDEVPTALIIASSDMNHYESDAITRVKDGKAIEQILELNPRGLHDVVMQEEISMCGFGPTVAMLTAARLLGASSAQLVKYATSADVSGDRDTVVGYAGVLIS
jgi:AmmeMemoRadiSam system protein B